MREVPVTERRRRPVDWDSIQIRLVRTSQSDGEYRRVWALVLNTLLEYKPSKQRERPESG